MLRLKRLAKSTRSVLMLFFFVVFLFSDDFYSCVEENTVSNQITMLYRAQLLHGSGQKHMSEYKKNKNVSKEHGSLRCVTAVCHYFTENFVCQRLH